MTDKDLIIHRVFEAPVEVVWNAWTNPDVVQCWWGPAEFSAPFVKIDLEEGGKYLYCMRSPEGEDYWSAGEFLEIQPMKRIFSTDHFSDEDGNLIMPADYGFEGDWPEKLEITVTFDEIPGGRTSFTLCHSGFPNQEDQDQAEQGWKESFDKLEQCLKMRV